MLPRAACRSNSAAWCSRESDETGCEVLIGDIYSIFKSKYIDAVTVYSYVSHHMKDNSNEISIKVELQKDGKPLTVSG